MNLMDHRGDKALHIQSFHPIQIVGFAGGSISGNSHLPETDAQAVVSQNTGNKTSQTGLDMMVFIGDDRPGLGGPENGFDIQIAQAGDVQHLDIQSLFLQLLPCLDRPVDHAARCDDRSILAVPDQVGLAVSKLIGVPEERDPVLVREGWGRWTGPWG